MSLRARWRKSASGGGSSTRPVSMVNVRMPVIAIAAIVPRSAPWAISFASLLRCSTVT